MSNDIRRNEHRDATPDITTPAFSEVRAGEACKSETDEVIVRMERAKGKRGNEDSEAVIRLHREPKKEEKFKSCNFGLRLLRIPPKLRSHYRANTKYLAKKH